MRRLPLSHELPYRFQPPQLNPVMVRVGAIAFRRMLRRQQRVRDLDITGAEELARLLDRGDGILMAPNHCDDSDSGVLYEPGLRLRRPFYFMAAYQSITGMARWVLPKVRVFPVDREVADRQAFKTGVEILATSWNPPVLFPEGEIYHMADRLTPIREGVPGSPINPSNRTHRPLGGSSARRSSVRGTTGTLGCGRRR